MKRNAKILGSLGGFLILATIAWSFWGIVDPMKGVPDRAAWVVQGVKWTWAWDRLGGEKGAKALVLKGSGKERLPGWSHTKGRLLDFLLPRLLGDLVVYYRTADGEHALITQISPSMKLPMVAICRFALKREDRNCFRVGAENNPVAFLALKGRCLLLSDKRVSLERALERMNVGESKDHDAVSHWLRWRGPIQSNLNVIWRDPSDQALVSEIVFCARVCEASRFRGRIHLREGFWPCLGHVSTSELSLHQSLSSAGLLRLDVRGPQPLRHCFQALSEESWARSLSESEVGKGYRGFQRQLGLSIQDDLLPMLSEEMMFVFHHFSSGPPISLPAVSLGARMSQPERWGPFIQNMAQNMETGSQGIFRLNPNEVAGLAEWAFDFKGTPSFQPRILVKEELLVVSTTEETGRLMREPGQSRVSLPEGTDMEGAFAFLIQFQPAQLADLLEKNLDALVMYEMLPGLDRKAFDERCLPVFRWLKLIKTFQSTGVLEERDILFDGVLRIETGERS